MARKSITKSKPASKQLVKKYQFAGANYSTYGQVANPYYVSGTYSEQAKMEAQRAYDEALALGNYAEAENIKIDLARKERETEKRNEARQFEQLKQENAAQNRQEVQQTATDALSSGFDLTKTYLKKRAAEKAAEKTITQAATTVGGTLAANQITAVGAQQIASQAGGVGKVGWSALAASKNAATLANAGTTAAGTTAGTTAGTAAGIGAGAGSAAGGTAAGTAAGTGASAAGTGASIGAGLATAGVGLGLNVAGNLIEKSGDDNDPRTFTAREKDRNLLGSAMKSAGTGVGIGATIGSFVPIPGVGTVVGGAIGGLIGGGIGLIKGIGENKRSKQIANEYKEYEEEQKRIEQERLAAEQKRIAAINEQGRLIARAANRGFVGSRLQGLNTGFGYNTSTNMNTQPTSSFYGKTGGKLPGGHVVPIGDDAVKFIGRKHSEGGIKLDPRTEVEGGETMDKVLMNGGKPNDYFFSAYLKLGGKSFAKRHEELVKSGAGQAEIQQLAKMQESVANKKGEKDRGPEQIAMYGGIHKYQTGDFKETADAVKDSDGIYRVKDAQGNILAESSDKNVAEKKAQNAAMAAADPDPAANPNKRRIYGMGRGDAASRKKYESIVMSPEDQLASRFARFEKEEGNEKGESMPNYGWNNLPAGEKQPTSIREATDLFQRTYGAKARALGITNPDVSSYIGDYMMNSNRKPEDFLLYASGKISLAQINSKDDLSKEWNANKDEILKNINSGKLDMGTLAKKRDDVLKTTRVLKSPTDPNDPDTAVFNPAYEATWKKRATLGLGYNNISGTKPPVTAEQSANAQSNANASNVTVRDQNQANAQTPSAQTSVAPGGTTNSAGQAAANAALFPEGRRAVTKDEYGESTSMKGVPSGQKEGKVFFGNVTESEYESMKAANPWFDFSNFDPSKRDHKNPDGSYGSSDVYKFQKAYNEHVRKGEKLKEDGKFGEQTATSRLHVADLKDIPMKGLDQPLKKAEVDLTKDTGLPKADKTTNEELEVANLKRGVNGSLLAGLGQLIPVGYALARPYKTEGNLPRMKSPGKVGAGSVRGAILPRVNMNAERAAAERNTVAIKNAIQNTNAGPGGIAAMMAANTAQGNQMLAIANQEQEANKQLVAEEARMGQQASQFNVETGLRAGMANMQSQLAVDQANLEAGIKEAALKIDEKRYKREEILGALDTAAARIAGIVKDEKSYRAQERLAKAIDNTGSYDRFTIYEQLQKEAKKKNSPYYGKTDAELRKIASNTYNEVLGRMGLEGEETAKTGGKRKYTSRLGELSRNKKSFNI